MTTPQRQPVVTQPDESNKHTVTTATPGRLNEILTQLYLDGIADGGIGGGMSTSVEKAQAALSAMAAEILGNEVDAYRESSGSITKLNIHQYQNSLKTEQRQRAREKGFDV